MIDSSLIDSLWVILAAILVFLMQPGFMCLESGLTRSKNSINVAVKNLIDFIISVLFFWLLGYGVMFGHSSNGWIGGTDFALNFDKSDSSATFFFFQVMFCGTATTIVSGAVAERMKFISYLIVAVILSSLIYPIFGHWAWNGVNNAISEGWLHKAGFVDFAGSTVVHSIGGWVSLATLLVIGPRIGRFDNEQVFFGFNGSNLPLSMLGTFLLWIGWLGFNGGSTLAMNESVPRIIVNTTLAGSAGAVSNLIAGYLVTRMPRVNFLINGSLGGLVAITANCHCVDATSSIYIGVIAGLICLGVELALIKLKIDDAVGAIPVHLGCGIWGTLAVAFFGKPELIGTGLSFTQQLIVQLQGILAAFAIGFLAFFLLISKINKYFPLRVSPEDEHNGLNYSEHGATTELIELCMALEAQAHTHDLSIRMPVEPFTEVGIIAERYNQVMDSLENALSHTEAVVSLAKDAIITFVNDTLEIININPSGMMMFGFAADHPIAGTKLPDLFSQTDFLQIKQPLYRGKTVETIGRRQCGTFFPLQATITDAGKGNNNFYIGTFRDITELKEQERSLRESEIRYRQLFENIGIATIMVDSDTKLIMVNKEAAELAGYDREQMEGQMHFAELLPPLEKISFEEYQELSRCQPGEVPISMESKIFNKSGKIIPVYMTISRIAGTDKTVTSIIDLSELHQAKDSLSKQKAFFYQLFEGSSQAIAALDTSLNVLDVNQGFKRIFDYSQQEVHSRSLLDFIIPETHIEEANTIQAAIQSGHMVQKESVRKNKDGRMIPVSIISFPVKLGNRLEGFFYIYEDITERKEFENQLYRQAFFDGLTEIPNRILFLERLERAIARKKRNATYSFAVMLLDLDRFKWVNDIWGHLTGDELLRQVAKRFTSCLRNGDTVARLGGDEFAVLIEDFDKQARVIEIAERLQEEAQRRFLISVNDVRVSASIGIVLRTDDYQSTEAILRDADIAMYKAKELGKARYQVFNRKLHEKVSLAMKLENDLRAAVEKKDFILYYQPIVSVKDRSIKGVEALIRWSHPEQGLISPDVFIPVAEESGLIIELGEWILREACSQMKSWQDLYLQTKDMKINVNLSARQFLQENLVATVKRILQETNLEATNLKIEITESVIMEGGKQTINKLNSLREIGVNLAIDDFGTGYSSLSSLHYFPITDLKIDRAFIRDLEQSDEAKAIVKTIVSLAHTLKLNLVAEGVETENQFSLLTKMQCDMAQGFLFSKALPEKEITNLFRSFLPQELHF